MQDIKIYHQDGLIYFDEFRVWELVLLKSEDLENTYLVIVDIQSYDYLHSDSEVKELEHRFVTKINNEHSYVWVRLEEFWSLHSVDDINGLIAKDDNSDDKFLYFGWHVPLYNNLIKFSKTATGYLLEWTATSDDVNYYDERAKENRVEISCELSLFVFESKLEYEEHEKQKSNQTESYFSILRSLAGQGIPERDTFDVSEILSRNLSEKEQNKYAWQLAIADTRK